MAINVTTLSTAVLTTDTTVALASITGVTAPNYQTGAGITYLFVDQEVMKVSGTPSTLATPVVRGELGSIVQAHAASAVVLAGLPTDFASFAPAVAAFIPKPPLNWVGISAPVANAASIIASGPLFHVTGTGAINLMVPPAGYEQGGEVTIIFDAAATWATGGTGVGVLGAAGTSYPFLASSTATQTGIATTFVLDLNIAKWVPSHL